MELYCQVVDDDPKFASRTSKQKKMVSLSNPPTTSPVYPVAVVSLVGFIGEGIGIDKARYDFDIQVSIIGEKNQEAKLEKLMSNIIKAVKTDRDDLHDTEMFYVRNAIPSFFQPFIRDKENPNLLFGSSTFSFYTFQ